MQLGSGVRRGESWGGELRYVDDGGVYDQMVSVGGRFGRGVIRDRDLCQLRREELNVFAGREAARSGELHY